MIRIWMLTALGLALASGGAATAQQSAGQGTASEGTAASAAPASDETGVKGVYSTKGMMGITTGAAGSADSDALEERNPSSELDEKQGEPVSE